MGTVLYFIGLIFALVYVMGLTAELGDKAPAGLKRIAEDPFTAFAVGAMPGVLLYRLITNMLDDIARSHDVLTTVDAKRAASKLRDAPNHLRLAEHLAEFNPNLMENNETRLEIERSRRPLKLVLETLVTLVRELIAARRERIQLQARAQAQQKDEASAQANQK